MDINFYMGAYYVLLFLCLGYLTWYFLMKTSAVQNILNENIPDNEIVIVFSSDSEEARKAYFLTLGVTQDEDTCEKEWTNFLEKRCSVCGCESPDSVHFFSPSADFCSKYLFVSENRHKVVFTRVCSDCGYDPKFLDALKNALIRIFKETN